MYTFNKLALLTKNPYWATTIPHSQYKCRLQHPHLSRREICH